MQLSIIIVSYNVKFFLEQCLAAVYKSIEQLEAEIWVVDNASTDNTIEYLKPKFFGVNFIENSGNAGFSKANNDALFQCNGKYVLFLNPDTLIAEDSLIKCIKTMEADALIGALGIRMVDGSGTFLPESKRSFPSLRTSFYKLSGLSGLFPNSRVFSRYSLGYLDEYKNHEVDVLSGAFMLAKKDLLIKLNGFDEAFFMYGEDIDLSYRIKKAGYKNYYSSESTIIHFKGESTKKNNLNYVKMFYTAMSIFVKKHYADKSLYLFSSAINIAIWLRAAVSVAFQTSIKTAGFLSKTFSTKKQKVSSVREHRTVIAGTEEECKEVEDLLVKVVQLRRTVGRVSNNAAEETVTNKFEKLEELIRKAEATEIIFCHGSLSYCAIITTIQRLPKKIAFRFHSKGTRSIVGSDSKETKGEFIGDTL